MRERSHKKGQEYQQAVKDWLTYRPFLGFKTAPFGDVYDLTCKATKIGPVFFDFSLLLKRDDQVRRILYVECKYRREAHGKIDQEFAKFLNNAYSALAGAEGDEAENAEFCFISNIPPDGWRRFLQNKQRYCQDQLEDEHPQIELDICNGQGHFELDRSTTYVTLSEAKGLVLCKTGPVLS